MVMPPSEATEARAPRRGWSRSASTWLVARAGQSKTQLPSLHDPKAPGVNVPEAALVNIDRGSVSRALSMLPEDQRLAIVLMDLAGHRVSEVAEMLGCPRNTVLSRVHRGHKRLASLLIEEDVSR